MADQFNPTLEYVDYPVLDRGMNTELPNRTMLPGGDGPLFRLAQNVVGHNGVLASWFGVFPLTEFATNGYPTISQNGSYFETAPDGLLNGQTVMWQFYDFPQTWNMTSTSTQSTYGSFLGVVVTSREIHIYSPQNQTWYNATPTYSTPAITVDVNGTTGVVTTTAAADANWSTYKICAGQLIEFNADGNWWVIESVDSDTQLTTSYTGANLTADPYIIRRCFGGRNYSHGNNLLYGTVFNGDLYLAGRTLAGAGPGPAVIRVSDIYSNVYTTEYLLAGFDLTGSMSTNGSVVDDLWDIKGIQILPDGRVVIATSEVPASKQGIVGNRLRYSSNTASGSISAQEIWNVSPGGFIDVVDHAGEITALGRLGPSTLTIHFHRGISLGTYTAQYDPPLAIQASRAKVGCFAPRSLVGFRGQELFLGADGMAHSFNGEETTEISDHTVSFIHNEENEQASFAIANVHGVVDSRRNHYRLFYCDNNFEDVTSPPAAYADYTINTYAWVIDLENPGQFYYETYGPHVTSAAFPSIGMDDADTGTYLPTSIGGDFGTLILGVNSAPPSAVADDLLGGKIIYGMALRDTPVGNHVWDSDAYTDRPSFVFETDYLDFGHPGVDKTLSHVLIWFSAADLAVSSVPTVEAYGVPGGYVTGSGPSTFTVTTDQPVCFSWEPRASEQWKIRVTRTVTTNNTAKGLMVHRMRVYYQTQAEVEAANPDL